MVLFILAIVLALIGGICVAVGNPKVTYDYGHSEAELPVRWIGVGVFAVAALVFLLSTMYTQGTGEAVLIRGAGGDVESVDTNPGLGFTMPWNKRSTWDTRLQRIELRGDGEGVDGPAVSVPSLGSSSTMDVAFVYSIPGGNVETLFNEHRSQDKLEENRLQLALRNLTTTVVSDFDTSEARQRRDDIRGALQNALEEEVGQEVTVNRVEIGDIRLPDSIEEALDRNEQAEADLATAETQANQQRVEAQAQADADQISRCGATTRATEQEINGETQTVVEVVPRPDSQCQNRLNNQVLLNKLIDKLDEIGSNGTLILPESLNSLLQLTPQG